MTPNEFQAKCARTANASLDTTTRLAVAALGIAGEGGEVCDLVKKNLGQHHRLETVKLLEELGDVLWYVAECCSVLGVSLESVMAANVAKLQQRYPDGFAPERSINRNA